MDPAPLIKAHDHAKAASDAAQTANSTVAINEHTLAAGEFSNAAKTTSSIEALRTLRLLEQHHQKLSELIRFSVDHPAKPMTSEKNGTTDENTEKSITQTDADDAGRDVDLNSASTTKTAGPVPSLSHQRRYPPSRETSSSLASNLASARGIRHSQSRAQPIAPSMSNDQAPGVNTTARRNGSRTKMQNMLDQKTAASRPSWVPPTQPTAPTLRSQSAAHAHESGPTTPSTASDEGFFRFYNTFGTFINKLSAPLAFAGLPLITEESGSTESLGSENSMSTRSKSKSVQSPSEEPDLTKIYSKAALGAVYRDAQSGNDSFYVVPTSGHTASYASILNFEQKEKRRAMGASVHADPAGDFENLVHDDFLDPKASRVTLSASAKRRIGKRQDDKDLHNVIEELNTENASLKHMLDKVTKRLAAFEANAQSSRLAIVDSMRLIRPGSPTSQSSGNTQVPDDSPLRKRNLELEEQMASIAEQFQAVQKRNKQLEDKLVRFQSKWDVLYSGAKARLPRGGEAAQSSDA